MSRCSTCAWPASQDGNLTATQWITKAQGRGTRPHRPPTYPRLETSISTSNCQGCRLLRDSWDHVIQTSDGIISREGELELHAHVFGESTILYRVHGRLFGSERYIDLFTLPEEPVFLGLPVKIDLEDNALSPYRWQRATTWIAECGQSHGKCRARTGSDFVPKRLVDVDFATHAVRVVENALSSQPTTETDDSITYGTSVDIHKAGKSGNKLFSIPSIVRKIGLHRVLGADLIKDPVKYIALSHCWGKLSSPMLLTSQTHARFTGPEGVAIDQLSKTFQDAINVTRQLGVRYLWIDSLCIVQDSPTDWAIESTKMADVYACAWLTLAATGSPSDTVGFSNSKSPLRRKPIRPITPGHDTTPDYLMRYPSHESKVFEVSHNGAKYKVHARLRPAHPDNLYSHPPVSEMPLLSRAWVMQERILSRRILHIGSAELLWECMEGVDCECSSTQNNAKSGKSSLDESFLGSAINFKNLFSKVDFRSGSYPEIHADWLNLVRTYSMLHLTVPTDRLPAISGLAKRFQAALKDEYLAGCWRKTLVQDIGWALKDWPIGQPWQDQAAPSWSWAAAAEGDINWAPCDRNLLTVHNVRVLPESLDKTGRLKEGRLEIRAPIMTVSLRSYMKGDERPDGEILNVSLTMYDAETNAELATFLQFFPDSIYWKDIDDLKNMLELTTLVVLGLRNEHPPVQAIIVRPVLGEQIYRRVGMIWFQISDDKIDWKRYPRSLITII